MVFRFEKKKDDGIRYILKNGQFIKKFLTQKTKNGAFLRNKKIIDINDPPVLYNEYEIYENNVL